MHGHDMTFMVLAISGFAAAFIDSTVGGGGLISLPTLLFLGLPPGIALGTNKLAGTMSAITSTASYLRSGKVNFRLMAPSFPLGMLGAAAGALIVHHLPSTFLRPMVLVLLTLVAGYTIWNKRLGLHTNRTHLTTRTFTWSCLASLAIGFYDGFFGPGTGSFLMMIFVLLGFDFVHASGNARAVNFSSNIGALATFAAVGSVYYVDGLVLGGAMVFGALLGSQFAIRKGATFVRPIFICVTLVVIMQQFYSLIQH